MAVYTYKGQQKKYNRPKKDGEIPKLFDNPTWILSGAYPIDGVKSRGSQLLKNINGSSILEYQLDFINLISNNPRTLLISGVSHKELVLHPRSNEFIIIQNHIFEFTNSAEDLRLGLLGATNSVIFLEKPIIPQFSLFEKLSKNLKSKVCCTNLINDKDIGAVEGQNKNVSKYSFFSPNKLMGIYYLSEADIAKLKKKTVGDTFQKNKYAFEIFAELKLKLIMDQNESTKNSNES